MTKRILLVAHEVDLVQSVPVTLRLAGHRVMLADCGLDAIKRARRLLPDLVLVDSVLPDMDGLTVIDILRRLPSTGTLPTMLFQPRPVLGANPSPLVLQQVAQALALCGQKDEGSPAEWESDAMSFHPLAEA
jgi:CheY-like chemotaxis protein